jgi:hypothetical protein
LRRIGYRFRCIKKNVIREEVMSGSSDQWPRATSQIALRRRDVLTSGGSVLAAQVATALPPAAIMTAASAVAQPASPRPHIVYIVADDLGWKDVGFHGSDIRTPNIDRLAQEGARLEQFYVQPMCTPTRAALLSGRYPFRYGLQTLVIPTPSKYGLPTDERLLPQTLREAGYHTAMVGKWHLGHADRAASITTTDRWSVKSTILRIRPASSAIGTATISRSKKRVT